MSARVAAVPTSVMLTLAEKIRQIDSSSAKNCRVIDLSLGQPDVPAPQHIPKAAQESLSKPLTSYSSSAGSEELRSLIAEKARRTSGVETVPGEVIVTAGSKHALFIALLSVVDPGEEVVVFEPYFPPYAEILALIGGILKPVPIKASTRESKPDVDALLAAVGEKTKAVLLNYPNNPAGWTLGRPEVERIVEHCAEKEIFLLSDEIYDRIVFDGETHSPAWTFSAGSDSVICLGSFSKTYSMVPYRLGFLIAHKRVCDGILKSQRATVTMVSPYAQSAGCAALSGPQEFVKSRLAKYEERRDRCCEILERGGLDCFKPSGAFYLFFRLPDRIRMDGLEFASRLLERHRVAVLPGAIFGSRWSRYVRISFATEDRSLYEGLDRLLRFCVESSQRRGKFRGYLRNPIASRASAGSCPSN